MKGLSTWMADHDRALAKLELGSVIALPLLFLLMALVKAQPFVDDTPILIGPNGDLVPGGGDDWFWYKIHAVKIVKEGLAEASFGKYIYTNHGFLYNYFVAGIFKIFGENTSFVYVAQTFLVGLTVPVLYLLIRGRVSRIAAITFIVLAGFQLYVDYFRSLSFLLMSENLFMSLFAVTFCAYGWAFARRSHVGALIAGILLGLTVLSRMSALVAALGVIVVGAAYFRFNRVPVRRTMNLAVAVGFVLAMSLFPLREYFATGQPDIDIFLVKHGWDVPPANLLEWPAYYAARWLFVLGIPQFQAIYDPGIISYRLRPHWTAAWLALIGYFITRFTWRRIPELWEVSMFVFLGLYISAYTFVSTIENYGGRSISVALPLVAVFAALFVNDLFGGRLPPRGERISAPAR